MFYWLLPAFRQTAKRYKELALVEVAIRAVSAGWGAGQGQSDIPAAQARIAEEKAEILAKVARGSKGYQTAWRAEVKRRLGAFRLNETGPWLNATMQQCFGRSLTASDSAITRRFFQLYYQALDKEPA